MNVRFNARHSSSNTPVTTSTPASRNRAMPRPETAGKGSRQPTTTRGMRLATINSAQGGVLP